MSNFKVLFIVLYQTLKGNSDIKYLLDLAAEVTAIVQHKAVDFADCPPSEFPPIKLNSFFAFFLADAHAHLASHIRCGRNLIFRKSDIVLKVVFELLDGRKIALLRRNSSLVSVNNRNLLLFRQLKKLIEAEAVDDLFILNFI